MKTKEPQNFPTLETWLADARELPPRGARFSGLADLERAWLLAAMVRITEDPLLVVFNSRAQARNAIDNFRFFAGAEAARRVHYLPALDFDFYRGLLPNPEMLCERNVALFHALNDAKGRVFITTLSALLQKAVPPSGFARATQQLTTGGAIDRDALVHALLEAGYQRQPTAYDPGIFSVRGGVIDVFCPLYENPLRLEFFGDEIEELRFFDPQSQRSLDKLDKALLIPVGQSLVPRGEDFEVAAQKIKERFDGLGIAKALRDEVIARIAEGQVSMDYSFLFPLLSRGSASVLEYFPAQRLTFWEGKEKTRETAFEQELPRLRVHLDLFEKQPLPVADASDLFLSESDVAALLENPDSFFFEDFSSAAETDLRLSAETVTLATEREAAKHKGSVNPALDAFALRFRAWMELGYRIHLVCHTRMHAERIQSLFEPYGLPGVFHGEGLPAHPKLLSSDSSQLHLWQGVLTESRLYEGLRVVLLSEEEIFGQKKRSTRAAASAWTSASDPTRMLSSFRDLKMNDFVVHREYGIGRYLGLKSMNFLGCENDYVLLEYRDGDKLYVPIYRLNILQKYVGGEGAGPTLDKMGGDRWLKAKGKAERAVEELAAEFLRIQAKRKLLPAYAFSPPSQDYRQFEMEFPFDETPDQMKAIDDVMADLSKPHPMDRLICGDVGYGKTEVAMRGAYRAILDGKQVAVLVPTTVLAFQHYESFRQRMKSTPARVEMISRLRGPVETKKVLSELAAGSVDIVIGTHRLLSTDVRFKDLGLLVVDEEHRFGVSHKERLKKIADSVHVLSMTATPIPRTLNMAMTGIKEISIITTPPPDRLSVRTFVCRRSIEVIAEAIGNELTREGQVYFVHNRIETIFKVAEELREVLPKVRVEIAHGQMDGETLEKKMLTFYRGEAQVLLCTSIIESGLDIPRANTILIDRANHFGLAQLYQLRGRVGRGPRRAYCYLLVDSESGMTEYAKTRLQVIQRYTDLGSGFAVASHDLEIRGAGDLLGKEQSGHLSAVGIDLYFELLEESIRALKGERKKTEIEPEIAMKLAASFPQEYLPDISERIQFYRRLSSVESEEGVHAIEEEIRDRLGPLPEEVVNLLGLMKIKLYLKKLHVLRMSCGPKKTSLQFAPSTPANAAKLVEIVQSDRKKRYAMTPDQKLVVEVERPDWQGQLREIQHLCDVLEVF